MGHSPNSPKKPDSTMKPASTIKTESSSNSTEGMGKDGNSTNSSLEDNTILKTPKANVYLPRSRGQRLFPSILLISAVLLYFSFCYFIAVDRRSLLSTQFLMGTPFFIGAISVLLANYRKPITTPKIFKLSLWLMLGIIFLSLFILGEGVICIVMASPIIYIAMLIGGLIMNFVCLKFWQTRRLYSFVLLPLLVLFLPIEQSPETYHVTHSTVIKATPEQVWQTINHIEAIDPKDFYHKSRLLPFMNVPTPKSAVTVEENGQRVRKCEWHGGITFDEPIISQVPNKQLRWQFVFYPDSVPPKTLDDHVTINGEHFKLLHGQYDLERLTANSTKLTFNVTYRINTNMNFYSGFWGKWVMDEFVEDTLGLYKRRLEEV